jgi:hypothetical protein
MDRRPSDRVLEEWDSVTRNVQRPAEAPRRRGLAGSFGLMLVPLAAVALVLAFALTRLGATEQGPGASSPASPGSSAIGLTPTIGRSGLTATASLVADGCTLEAAIQSWEGAAGSRIATIALRNTGQAACEIAPLPTAARLIDGSGRALAEVDNPDNGARIEIGAGQTATTDTSVSNVCGAAAVPPVTIQIDFGDLGTVTAKPLDPTDATVPPCNGPTQPSEMSIHPWSR